MLNQDLDLKLEALFNYTGSFIDYEGSIVTFQKHKPASPQEIESIIFKGLKLPLDYINFLKRYNGCLLFAFEDLGGFEFLGTQEIGKENKVQQETYEDEWDEQITIFGRVIGDGDYLGFRNFNNNEYEIVDCYHDESPQSWKAISRSFNNFLKLMIDEKGKKFWLNLN